MKIKLLSLILTISFVTVSCNLKGIAEILFQDKVNTRQNTERITQEEASRWVELYWAITIKDTDKVREYMEEGYDPNKCMGEEGWMVKTPLNVVARSFYDTFAMLKIGKEIPEPLPDVAILQSLVEAGANVNERPYIWCRVYTFNQLALKHILREDILYRKKTVAKTDEEIEELNIQRYEEALSFVNVSNRVLEAFLKAGADPDKRGHPYPYSLEAKRMRITDEEANGYFAKGTRPINEAIKKGMWWESQVDLLLQYTTLDEDSLKAAEESKEPAMVEKITRLWNEQKAGNGFKQ